MIRQRQRAGCVGAGSSTRGRLAAEHSSCWNSVTNIICVTIKRKIWWHKWRWFRDIIYIFSAKDICELKLYIYITRVSTGRFVSTYACAFLKNDYVPRWTWPQACLRIQVYVATKRGGGRETKKILNKWGTEEGAKQREEKKWERKRVRERGREREGRGRETDRQTDRRRQWELHGFLNCFIILIVCCIFWNYPARYTGLADFFFNCEKQFST